MTTFTERYVALTVATLKADGKSKKVETGCIQSIAEVLGLDVDKVDCLIAEEKKKDTDILSLAKLAAECSDDERQLLLKACAGVAISDNSLAEQEVALLLQIGEAMGIPTVRTVLQIVAAVCAEGNVKVELTTKSGDDEFTEVFD